MYDFHITLLKTKAQINAFYTREQNGFKIKTLELRLYTNILQNKPLSHSIITAYLETDEHSIETLYDEGDLEDNALEKSTELLTNSLGLSGLILRLIISLENTLKVQNDQ